MGDGGASAQRQYSQEEKRFHGQITSEPDGGRGVKLSRSSA
jgi:hypothetical protein